MCFVDYKNAFDSVNRKTLMEKIYKLGISRGMYQIIGKIYNNTLTQVRVGTKLTEKFESTSGARQGCTLSAILYNVYTDDVDEIQGRHNIDDTIMGKRRFHVIKYADDMEIVSDTPEGLQKMLNTLET